MDDLELVRSLRERREDAVGLFVERYRPIFHHCIGSFEPDAALRDDLFQELVWHALERLQRDNFDPERGSFGTWLYRVAWCRCVDLKRQQNARRRVKLQTAVEDLPERVDPEPEPAEALGMAEIGELVRRALARLDTEDRALLELRHVEELTLQDIAERLSITIEQAKYRLKRASVELKRALIELAPRHEVVE